jgi:hypothetical protein
VRHFQLFYLPRPWWGWMGQIRAEQRPVSPYWMMTGCAVLLMLGGALLARALQAAPLNVGSVSMRPDQAPAPPTEGLELAVE